MKKYSRAQITATTAPIPADWVPEGLIRLATFDDLRLSSSTCKSGTLDTANTISNSSTNMPMPMYGVEIPEFPRASAEKTKYPPTIGPKIQPTPLNVCAILMRVGPVSGGPSTVVYGFAIVSRQVMPAPITNKPRRNAQ